MRILFSLLVLCLACEAATAATPFTGSYSQNFDGLHPLTIKAEALEPLPTPYHLAQPPFARARGMAGWYVHNGGRLELPYRVYGLKGAGTGYVNFGPDNNRNRSLGSISNGQTALPVFSLILRNDTGATVNRLRIRFDGEQWRGAGEPATLRFDYQVSARPDPRSRDGFLSPAEGFSFTATGSGIVNGKREGLHKDLGGVLADLEWQPGAFLVLRWTNKSRGAGLAIDNFSMEAVD